jgi:hypothetical protein
VAPGGTVMSAACTIGAGALKKQMEVAMKHSAILRMAFSLEARY